MSDIWLPDPERLYSVAWQPNPGTQTAFLASWAREVMIGGAVGGGKSEGLVASPLRWASHPRHRAILFRRERADLQELIDRTRDLYPKLCPSAVWLESRKRWEFPSGAKLWMGSCERDSDIEAHKSFEYNWIGFDELTTFTKYQYTYMLSRNRSKDDSLPLQLRSGTNPDGPGHGWVFKRLVKNREPFTIYRSISSIKGPDGKQIDLELTQQFIPSTVFDNPKISGRDEYIAGLMAMGQQLAEALLYGRWDYFRGQMFPYGEHGGLKVVDRGIKGDHYVVRCLDYGWTDPTVVYWLVIYPQRVDGQPDIEVAAELALTETSIGGIIHHVKAIEAKLIHEGMNPPSISVIDPATKGTQSTGRSTLDLFQEGGLWFEPANNDRQAGWGWLRQLLESGRIGVWEGVAPYLMQTLGRLARNPNKAEDILDKQDDHPADTLRYGAMAIYDKIAGILQNPGGKSARDNWNRDTYFEEQIGQLRRAKKDDTFDTFGGGW